MTRSAVLITGAAKRIGRAMALHLASLGYDIALHYHHSIAEAEHTAAAIKELGRQVVLLPADLRDNAAAAALPEQAKAALPHLNAMIISASVFAPSPFYETDEELLEQYLQIHVKSSFFLAQSFARNVQKGTIISMLDTNVAGHASLHFSYLLSKKALADLTRMLARELAPALRVNAIAPGITSQSDDISPEMAAEKAASLPLRRIASPSDIAHAAAFLLEADYLTGHTLFIDGGQQLL